MKKTLSILIAVLMALSLVTIASAAPLYRGDLDRNGKILAKEARQILRMSAHLDPVPAQSSEDFRLADVDGDGRILAKDARSALRMSASLEARIPLDDEQTDSFKIGFIFLHDENSAYDLNFYLAAKEAQASLGLSDDQVIMMVNVPEDNACYDAAAYLADKGCDVVFADSFGYEAFMLEAAKDFPDVQFYHAGGVTAHTSQTPNFHNVYASIYEGRYLTGVAAGLKLVEMINSGRISESQAKLGFVAAFPYAEVVSSYTAFFLGARSVCPSATMDVKYANAWYDEALEKQCATELIRGGCVLISQYSDSLGAPIACEAAGVPNVSYNGSARAAGPDTYLISCRIDWKPCFEKIVKAYRDGAVIGPDYTFTLADGAVKIEDLNTAVAAQGTEAWLDIVADSLRSGKTRVFDTDSFTVNGEKLSSYMADVDLDYAFTPDTQVISDGAFLESEYRSAPYFDVRIDGISQL